MNPDDFTKTEAELEAFVDDVFASLPRSDQRAKGNLYLRGLMLDGRRKSMQPMGTRLGIDYQQLQQFVSASPWKVEPVRRVLVRRALQLIRPDAWVVDDTRFKKDGAFSPCVARQYSGTLGKIGNCQMASASTRRPIMRRAHWIGVSTCPGPGMTPARTRTRKPKRSWPAGQSPTPGDATQPHEMGHGTGNDR